MQISLLASGKRWDVPESNLILKLVILNGSGEIIKKLIPFEGLVALQIVINRHILPVLCTSERQTDGLADR